MKKLIFGLGTGRCGTVSLSALLNSQKNADITHEFKPVLPWKFSKIEIETKLKNILIREAKYVGDIASYYLLYVDYILSKHPDAKFVCLKRDKEKVINSFLKKTRRRNHWINHFGIFWKKDPIWDKCFPSYITLSKRNALKKYWEEYYKIANELLRKYPESITILDMEYALNTEDGLIYLLHFLNIEEDDMVLKKNITKNTS